MELVDIQRRPSLRLTNGTPPTQPKTRLTAFLHTYEHQLFWSIFLLAVIYINTTYKTSFVLERPVPSAIVIFFLVAIVLQQLAQYFPYSETASPQPSGSYLSLKLREDDVEPQTNGSTSSSGKQSLFRGSRPFYALCAVVVLCISLRVLLFQIITFNTQCMITPYRSFLPLALSLYEIYGTPPLPSTRSQQSNTSNATPSIRRYAPAISTLVISIGATIGFIAIRPPVSTYICANVLVYRVLIPFLQILDLLLEVIIIITTSRILFPTSSSLTLSSSTKPCNIAGWIFLSSSLTISIPTFILLCIPTARHLLRLYVSLPYLSQLLSLSIATVLLVYTGLYLVTHIGTTKLSIVTIFASLLSSTLIAASESTAGFHPMSLPLISLAFLIGVCGAVLLYKVDDDSSNEKGRKTTLWSRIPRALVFGMCLLVIVQLWLWNSASGMIPIHHPIDHLMREAVHKHDNWTLQASSSKTLDEAITNYKRRYGFPPPPRFDQWYAYATKHKSMIIDDFDSIQNDLEPFWDIMPFTIRARTWEAISDPFNDVAGIMVRKGKLTISEGTPGTHYWMVVGVKSMIEPFAKSLPDMDIAINLDDECRNAVPHTSIEWHRTRARRVLSTQTADKTDFSIDRGRAWDLSAGTPVGETRFEHRSWKPTFRDFGSIGCAESSPARRERPWDLRSACTSCSSPHTFHGFVSNWTHAADPCHQPDLADLHGVHLSPGAFKSSIDLMPIFSQSKAHGYNDILYPSAWNYLDKVKYDPTWKNSDPAFSRKEATLFWRGATSEGVSSGSGAWKGMVRQRVVHLFNNARTSDRHYVLLPTQSQSAESHNPSQPPHNSTYTFQSISPSTFRSQISTSIGIVDHIERCWNHDCSDQHREFQPQNTRPVDFQEHWRYKYLIDLDGAGFSGRFIPFLQSKSLILKSGLMREWWESRVHAWVHFVPIDVRLQEIWSVLAYFAGWKEMGDKAGNGEKAQRWYMRPRDAEAEKIASQGREWAGKVLRKEDMEVYMFRLLLEWARVTDDDRENIGYGGAVPVKGE